MRSVLLHELVAVGIGDAALGGAELRAGPWKGRASSRPSCSTWNGMVMVARSEIFRLSGLISTPFSRSAAISVFQMFRVDDHSAAHDADDLRAQNTGRDQVQDKPCRARS